MSAVSGLTALSRLAGFAREVLIARAYGTTAAGSALAVAHAVPTFSRSLVSEDVAQGALVPLLAEDVSAGRAGQAWQLARATAIWASVLLTAATAALAASAGLLANLLLVGDSGVTAQLTAELMRLLLPIVAINGMLASSSALLIAHGRFSFVAFAPALSNVPAVAGLLADPDLSVQGAAILLTLGYGLQTVLLLAVAVLRYRVPLPARGTASAAARQLGVVARLALPVMLALGMATFSGLIDVAFSTLAGTFGPAAFDKAIRLIFLPYGVFAVAVSIVALPSLVEARRISADAFDRRLEQALRLVLAMLVPIAVVTGLFATPLVALAYERGAFGGDSVEHTAAALLGLAVALPAMGLSLIGGRAWLSRKRPWVVVRWTTAGLLLNVALDAALVSRLGLLGLGVATCIAHGVVGVGLLLTATHDRRRFAGRMWRFGARFGLALAIAAVAGLLTIALLRATPLPDAARAALALVPSAAALLVAATALGARDYVELLDAVRGRRGEA